MRRRGFSLLEVLVSITLVGILIAILLPAVQFSRETARRINCESNIRQIGLATMNFESRRGFLPRCESPPYEIVLHWHTQLLSDLEETQLDSVIQKELQLLVNWDSLSGRYTPVSKFVCPSDHASQSLKEQYYTRLVFAPTNYVGVVGQSFEESDGIFPDIVSKGRKRLRFKDVRDGLSNTLAIGERPLVSSPIVGAWQSSQEYGSQSIGVLDNPTNWYSSRLSYFTLANRLSCPAKQFGHGVSHDQCDQFHFWSLHGHGVNFVRLDGSSWFVARSIDQGVLRSLSTIAGGEVAVF